MSCVQAARLRLLSCRPDPIPAKASDPKIRGSSVSGCLSFESETAHVCNLFIVDLCREPSQSHGSARCVCPCRIETVTYVFELICYP